MFVVSLICISEWHMNSSESEKFEFLMEKEHLNISECEKEMILLLLSSSFWDVSNGTPLHMQIRRGR